MIRAEDVRNKDTAYLWLKEKIEAGWTTTQVRDMMNLYSQFPYECKLLVEEVLGKIELLESKNWAQKKLIRCENCGYQKTMKTGIGGMPGWKSGTRCPKCLSERFFPVVETAIAPGFISRRGPVQNLRPLFINSATVVLLILGAFLFISHAVTAYRHFGTGMIVKCENCNLITKLPLGPTPLTCPRCKQKQMYNAVKCAKCGTIFTHKQPPDYEQSHGRLIDIHNPPKCPECGSNIVEMIVEIPEE